MKTDSIKRYAPQARTDFIAAVTKQSAKYGIRADEVLPIEIKEIMIRVRLLLSSRGRMMYPINFRSHRNSTAAKMK